MPKKTKSIKKSDIKADKPWLKKVGFTSYKEESKATKKTFLIICEGQSESLYFSSFPILSAKVITYDIGCSNNRLVECAVDLASEGEYDEVWCVFDMDTKPDNSGQDDDFNSAIQLCANTGLKCAYSNDAFELWIYLHYHFTDQRNHRNFYYEQLSQIFGINYSKQGKKRKFSLEIYQLLKNDERANQNDAIQRSKTLVAQHADLPPHTQNPVTYVHELVEELNKYLTER